MTAPFGTEPLGGLSPEELLLALEAARAGTSRVDLATRELRWSPSLAALHGLSADEAPGSVEESVALVHPDDRERLAHALRRAIEDGVPYAIDVRAVWPDGSVHWLQSAGRRVDDADGRPRALVGVARDIDAERRAQVAGDEIRALVDAVYSTAPVGLAFVGPDLRYVRINEAMAAIGGRSVEAHLGRTVREALPGRLGDVVEARVRAVRDTGEVVTYEDLSSLVVGDDGVTPGEHRHYSASYYPVPGADGGIAGVGIVVSDTTARVHAIEAAERALERTQFLADVSAALDASLDYDATLAAVADLAVRRIADWCSIDMVDDAGGMRNVAVAHVDPAKVAMARDLQQRYPPDLDAPTGAPNVALRTGESELYPELSVEVLERTGADAEQLELIRELGLSSAMIVPLRARGRVLGALTLIATHGRPDYGAEDLAFAEQIAGRSAIAVDNARLYREAREQQRLSAEARALLDTLIDQAPIGIVFLDAEHRFLRVNDRIAEINGLPAADHVGRRLDELFPDLAGLVAEQIDTVIATGRPVPDMETSRPLPDGTLGHHLVSHYPVRLGSGELLGVGVTVTDMTARVADREELRAQRDLYEALMRAQSELGEAFALLEGERIVYVNRATERLTGRTAEELYALESVFALVAPEHRRAVGARLRDARLGVEPRDAFVTEVVRPDGSRVPIEAAARPLPAEGDDRLVIIARDITERHHQEAERERLLRTEQAARRASEAAHARVRLLADASALLERAVSDDASLQDVAELLVAQVSDAAIIDVLGLDGRIRRLGAASRAPGGDRVLAQLAEGERLQRRADHPIPRALREQQAAFLDDPAERYMRDVARDEADIARFREAAGRSLAVVPLVARGRSVGVLTIGWQRAGRRPARDEWSLVEALAQRIALAVDSALQYQERAYVARTLQQSLLPGTLPAVPGADLAAEYVPAGEGMEVGGDFFDVFAIGDADEWALVIGDVCGKGAEAAAVTALARYTLRAVSTRSPSPAATLATLNEEMLRQMPEPRFLTAVLGHLTVRPGGDAEGTLASGGHLPPLFLRAGGTPEVAACSGTLLGVEPDAEATDCPFTLGPGDALVLYTDGITEARVDRPLSPEALAAALQASLADGAAAIARRAVALAEEQAEDGLRDDVAVLVVRIDEA